MRLGRIAALFSIHEKVRGASVVFDVWGTCLDYLIDIQRF